jgi:hypothetical protein
MSMTSIVHNLDHTMNLDDFDQMNDYDRDHGMDVVKSSELENWSLQISSF